MGGGIKKLALRIMGKLEVLAKISEKALESGFPKLRGLILFYKGDVIKAELFQVDGLSDRVRQ